ncbi:TetR family transcriptional regulator [Methylosinus sp. H3A]|uniref:TetR/AcrR family transcriptional regulator n=1 Tax=Methylosinus sp. H3A TaxID=2785786 RepID=UPI0018C2E3A1|nr:TetR/AcrR family transcriptional regulator [Methylosinus sp. H3A]MBG0810699.1 TetR family transcriptional regulator [Methylosinus sp. H3A]
MRPENSEKRSGEQTRRRILAAAITRFARASYEEVKLRDIAADVGVDVALVHRSFGSKEQLFAAAVVDACPAALLTAERSRLSALFSSFAFESQQHEGLHIFVRSLTSPLARDLIRACCYRDFIGPLAAKLDGPAAQQRAALFVSCLIGFSLLREVLRIEPLLAEQDSRPLIERLLAACLDEDGDAAQRRETTDAEPLSVSDQNSSQPS